MSTNAVSDLPKTSKKPFNLNDSGELDVFEAARYFSDLNEVSGYTNGSKLAHKIMRDEKQPWKGGRMSFDMPSMRESLPPSQTLHFSRDKQPTKEKKYKQPSSPGGRLASFLNSLFNQKSSKKKKSKSMTNDSLKDDDESPGGRRRRRSSISHFRIPSILSDSNSNSKSIYSKSGSGFRTPPPYAYTPTKSYKDLSSDRITSIRLDEFWGRDRNGNAKSKNNNTQIGADKKCQDYDWLSNGRYSDKQYKNRVEENRRTSWADQYLSEEKDFKNFKVVDEGGDSDSSSDLFELPNFDLSGLPVYETTNMETIKRGAPISSAAR